MWARIVRAVRFLTIDQWRAIDAQTERTPGQAGTVDLRVLAILLTCCITLTLQEYVGNHATFAKLFGPSVRGPNFELYGFMWWSGWRVFGYVVLPMLVLLCLPG